MRALLLLVALLAAAPGSAVAKGPVLGSPEYLPNGSGWGTAAPEMIHNGGAPSGGISGIAWSSWGGATAHGRGTGAIYRPGGGYYPPVRVQLRARRIGTCPGHPERAYTQLEVRSPPWPGGPLGPWFRWSASRTICDASEEDHAPLPGMCAKIGPFDGHGTAQQVEAYRVGCAPARAVVKRVIARKRPARCLDRGCAYRIGAYTCRLDRLHTHDVVGEDERPVQRLVCRRGGASITAFVVI